MTETEKGDITLLLSLPDPGIAGINLSDTEYNILQLTVDIDMACMMAGARGHDMNKAVLKGFNFHKYDKRETIHTLGDKMKITCFY